MSSFAGLNAAGGARSPAIQPIAEVKKAASAQAPAARRGAPRPCTLGGGRLEEPLDPADVHEVDLERANRLRDRAREILRLELAFDFAVLGEHAEGGVFEDVWRNAIEIANEAKPLDSPTRARLGLAPQEASG